MSPSPFQPVSVAVVGAGMAGAACAAGLREAGMQVSLFDKSTGVGGRMATRRVPDAGLSFDHGSTVFGARGPRFKAMLARAQAAGVVTPWSPAVYARWPGALPKQLWVVRHAATALPRHLVADLPVRLEHTVQRLQRGARGWLLHTAEAAVVGPFDQVILAMPPAQAAVLLAGQHDGWAETLRQWPMQPCWTLMAATPEVDWPWDAAVPDSGPLSWVVREDRKPGRGTAPGVATWVAQASPRWSAAHLEASPESVARMLGQALAKLMPGGRGPKWLHLGAHRWRHALAVHSEAPAPGTLHRSPAAPECWWDARLGLGVCGDHLAGGGVEGAWRSGDELADTLAAWLDQETVQVAAA